MLGSCHAARRADPLRALAELSELLKKGLITKVWYFDEHFTASTKYSIRFVPVSLHEIP